MSAQLINTCKAQAPHNDGNGWTQHHREKELQRWSSSSSSTQGCAHRVVPDLLDVALVDAALRDLLPRLSSFLPSDAARLKAQTQSNSCQVSAKKTSIRMQGTPARPIAPPRPWVNRGGIQRLSRRSWSGSGIGKGIASGEQGQGEAEEHNMPWQRWLLCAELDTTKDGGSRNSYSRRDRNRWNRHVVERCPCVGRRYGAGRRAKMSKRQAGVQITKDDYNDDRFPDEEEPVGTWQKASEEVLAQRKIRKAKRPPPRTAEEIQKFGVAAEPSSAAAGPAADASANPFANISLVAPAATSVPPAATGAFSFGVAPTASTSFKPTSSTSSDTNAPAPSARLVVAVGRSGEGELVHAAFSRLSHVLCRSAHDVPSGVPDQPG